MFRILFLLPFLISCESLEPATETQCETLYDHLIALNYQKDTSLPENTQLENDLMKSISSSGVDFIFTLTGQKDKVVRRCIATLNQMEVLSCIKTKNKNDWQKNCSLEIE